MSTTRASTEAYSNEFESSEDTGVAFIDVSPVSEDIEEEPQSSLVHAIDVGTSQPARVLPGESRPSSGGLSRISEVARAPVEDGARLRPQSSAGHRAHEKQRVRLARGTPPKQNRPSSSSGNRHAAWALTAFDYAHQIAEKCPWLGWTSAVAYSSPSTHGLHDLLVKGTEPADEKTKVEEMTKQNASGLDKHANLKQSRAMAEQVLAATVAKQRLLLRERDGSLWNNRPTEQVEDDEENVGGASQPLISKGCHLIAEAERILQVRTRQAKEEYRRSTSVPDLQSKADSNSFPVKADEALKARRPHASVGFIELPGDMAIDSRRPTQASRVVAHKGDASGLPRASRSSLKRFSRASRKTIVAGDNGKATDRKNSIASPRRPSLNRSASRRFRRSVAVNLNKPPALDFQKIGRVFWQLETCGEMPEDRIVRALGMLGYRHVEDHMDWLEEIMESTLHDRGWFSRKEFHIVVEQYSSKNWDLVNSEFTDLPRSATGLLEQDGVAEMLRRRGITPLPWVIKDLMQEVLMEQSIRGLNIREFAQLEVTLVDRFGFTIDEAETFKEVFHRYDPVGTGEMPMSNLMAAIAYIGYPRNKAVTAKLWQATSEDTSGMLTQDAFFRMVRLVRESFVEALRAELQKRGNSTTVALQDVPGVLWAIGYHIASPKSCRGAANALGLVGAAQVNMEQVYAIAERVQFTRGLTEKEMEEAPEAFRNFGLVRKGLLCVIECRLAFWWLGYPMTSNAVRELIAEFDEDKDECIDLKEFIRCLGRCHDAEVERIRRMFTSSSVEVRNSRLPRRVLLAFGHEPGSVMDQFVAEEMAKHGDTPWSLWELVEMAIQYRVHTKERLRRQVLFSNLEVDHLRGAFNKRDPDGMGYLEGQRLADLITELYPASTYNPHVHAEARELLRTADANKNNRVEFEEFLWIMRSTYDKLARDEFIRELQVIREAGFSQSEVQAYRAIFRKSALGELLPRVPASAVKEIMLDVCRERSQESRLYQLLRELGTAAGGSLSFPDFLLLTWKIENAHSAQVASGALRRRSTLPSLPAALQPHVW